MRHVSRPAGLFAAKIVGCSAETHRFGDGIIFAPGREDMAIARRHVQPAELETLDEGLLMDTDSEETSHPDDTPVFALPGPTRKPSRSSAPPIPVGFILTMLLIGAGAAALVFHTQLSQLW